MLKKRMAWKHLNIFKAYVLFIYYFCCINTYL